MTCQTVSAGQGKGITWSFSIQAGGQSRSSSAHRRQQVCGLCLHSQDRGACNTWHARPEQAWQEAGEPPSFIT